MTPVSYTSRPARTGTYPLVLSFVALSLALLLAACGGGGKKNSAQSATTTTRPKVLDVKTSVLKIGSVDIQSAGPTNPIDTPTGRAVLGAAQAYVDDAVFAPLKTGRLGNGYPGLFHPALKTAVTGADQLALTDLEIGKVTKLTTTATPVHLSSLEGTLGEVMYVATNFDLTMKATGDTGPLTITRHIELTYAKNGSAWHVNAYRVQAIRKATAGTTTTTATRGTTP